MSKIAPIPGGLVMGYRRLGTRRLAVPRSGPALPDAGGVRPPRRNRCFLIAPGLKTETSATANVVLEGIHLLAISSANPTGT